MIVTPTDSQLYTKLGAFIASIVPGGTAVIKGLPNRAAIPAGSNFVCMQEVFQNRLSTNTHGYADPFPVAGERATQSSFAVGVQIDCYGPLARDNATMVATMFRDPYGCEQLAPECQPLYADEAKQSPFVAGEEQYLQRWTLTATIQFNPVVTVPQEFADALDAVLVNVDVEFPP